MGHERIANLPRTRRWNIIVAELASAPETDIPISEIAFRTIDNVRDRLDRLKGDSGVQAAFQYLVGIAQPLDVQRPPGFPPIENDATVLRLTAGLHRWVDQHTSSTEYASLAKEAAAETISSWATRRTGQTDLFSSSRSAAVAWTNSANGAAFSEIARHFFGSLTTRYLKYFLEREASAAIPDLSAREAFDRELTDHMSNVARHAFEATKIAQSFAAGWYNKNAVRHVPSSRTVSGFLAIAFNKIREELRREAQ